MTKQLEHYETETNYHKFNIKVICDNIKTPENIGHLFRICDAFAVSSIIFCGPKHPLPNKTVHKVSRSTDKIVPCTHVNNIFAAIEGAKNNGYKVVALELTNSSISLPNLQLSEEKIAIVIGSESNGIKNEYLDKCDIITNIPIYGQNSSINVAMALSICLYAIISK